MGSTCAYLPSAQPLFTAPYQCKAQQERCRRASGGVVLSKQHGRHGYPRFSAKNLSSQYGAFLGGKELFSTESFKERCLLKLSYVPVANFRKRTSCLALPSWVGFWRVSQELEGERKEESDSQRGDMERPDMSGRLTDTGPPSTSSSSFCFPTRLPASLRASSKHQALRFPFYSALCKGETLTPGMVGSTWGGIRGSSGRKACSGFRASAAARKTVIVERPAEVEFAKAESVESLATESEGARRTNGRTAFGEDMAAQLGAETFTGGAVDGQVSGASGLGDSNGGGVDGPPKRRRRSAAVAGDEGKAKRTVGRRRRATKPMEAGTVSGEIGTSESDEELGGSEKVDGVHTNGASVNGASVKSSIASGAVAGEAGLNRRKRAVRRRRTAETDSDNESGTSTLDGARSESDGEAGVSESGVNGHMKPARRRRSTGEEMVASRSEDRSPQSTDDENDEFSNPFSDGSLGESFQNGRATANGQPVISARGQTFLENEGEPGEETEEEIDGPDPAVGFPLPAAPAPAPAKPLLTTPKPARKPAQTRARTGKTPASFVKEKMRQGLAVVSGNAGTDGEIDNSIDPHRLVRGELVVHKRVGIGRFRELRAEKVEGRAQPVLFVYLEYADGLAKLPAHQAHRLLYRYRSPGIEGKEPGLSKLKDRRAWERRKSKGRAHIQKMVINILKLYRLRAAVSRPPYPRDGEAQTRFEATFRYQPTEHQQQAFDAVRDDMCKRTVPMDRIVCGDVGFGKTEVALRAIFRAANAGRQVAVLAPTTVLAKQHYDVIRERFKDFPEIEIAMLSRLAAEKEKRAGLQRMASGDVQVAVGTHALLGESVRFKDLGLLVVDEEQRFGVRQKEKMKDMKTEIDVLTLSATPIPRTLEQATRGLKDLSLITTPPPSRRPIKTHLQQFDEKLVEWAIEQELGRGGQVYYIVPRIHGGKTVYAQSIIEVQEELRRKMPDVTVDMAHGQMTGPELDRAMRAFREGKTQILLCTSIVESGLDIPNCNTIIITEVEKFGLAQIYQLRGRVGRSNVEAHAYLLYAVGNREELSPAAELRLQALEECVDLGAGVHVAQRDLTIRGTGEVFGEKQSGKLSTEIGADLFNEMLFDSLYRAQTETLPKVYFDDVKVDFVVDTLVPHDYIDCTEGRDQFLEDMEKAARGGVESANEFYLEMEERLGPPPPGAKRRLQMLVMKRLAADLGITRIRTRPKFILFETSMSIGAFQMLFDAIDEEKAVDIKNNLIYKEGSAGFLLKSLLGLPPEKEAQDAFECLMEMSKGLDSFMNLDRSSI